MQRYDVSSVPAIIYTRIIPFLHFYWYKSNQRVRKHLLHRQLSSSIPLTNPSQWAVTPCRLTPATTQQQATVLHVTAGFTLSRGEEEWRTCGRNVHRHTSPENLFPVSAILHPSRSPSHCGAKHPNFISSFIILMRSLADASYLTITFFTVPSAIRIT